MATFIGSLTTWAFNEAGQLPPFAKQPGVELEAFLVLFTGTKECAVPSPTRGQGLCRSWVLDEEMQVRKLYPAVHGGFKARSHRDSRVTPLQLCSGLSGSSPRCDGASSSSFRLSPKALHWVGREASAEEVSQSGALRHLFELKPTSVHNAH